jgi:hypothetical protein
MIEECTRGWEFEVVVVTDRWHFRGGLPLVMLYQFLMRRHSIEANDGTRSFQ